VLRWRHFLGGDATTSRQIHEHAKAGYSIASCALIHPGERRAAADYWIRKENVTSFVILQSVILPGLILQETLRLIVFYRRRIEMKGVNLRCGFLGAMLLGAGLAFLHKRRRNIPSPLMT